MTRQRTGTHDTASTDQTRNLIEYLRELVRTARTPVRDCAAFDDVLWLSGLPATVARPKNFTDSSLLFMVDHRPRKPAPEIPKEVAGWLDPNAVSEPTEQPPELAETGPGHSVVQDEDGQWIEVNEILREDAADVLRAYTRWLPQWQKWSHAERVNEPHRALHRRLRRIARRLQEDGDVVEAVLGVGLLCGAAGEGRERVRRHLLTAPVAFDVKRDSVEVTVSLVPDMPLRLEDRDFLDQDDNYTSELLGPLQQRLDSGDLHPLAPEVEGILNRWCERALTSSRTVRFDAAWEPAAPAADWEVRLAPALVLRERGRSAITGFYDAIAQDLARPGTVTPLGLAQLLRPMEADERLAWSSRSGDELRPALGPDPLFPLLTNAAQREVLERLQQDTGIVVQGPPGTGKTHTIANLVCALLADGKRVLVTSEKDQALRVLRSQLPPELRELCVLQTDARSGGAEELERSVRALSRQAATTTPEQLAGRIDTLQSLRRRLADEVAGMKNDLRAVREAEWYEHPEVAPDYRGRVDEIVAAVGAARAEHSWLPRLPLAAPPAPSITRDEAERLLSLILRHGSGILDEPAARCPDPDDLPTPSEFQAAITGLETARATLAQAGADPLADAIAGCGDELTDFLRDALEQAGRILAQHSLPANVCAWPADNWRARALTETLAGARTILWDQIRNLSPQADEAQRALLAVEFAHVAIPEDLSPGEASRWVRTGRELHRFLDEGGELRKRFKRTVEKEANGLLEQCTVDGRGPANAPEVAAALAHLQVRVIVDQLNGRWTAVGAPAVAGDATAALAELLDRIPVLNAITEFAKQAAAVHAALAQPQIKNAVRTPKGWEELRSAVQRTLLHRDTHRAEQVLEDLAHSLPEPSAVSVPELAAVHRAVTERDPQTYQEAVAALAAAYRREAGRREARKLAERLTAEHPALARMLTDTAEDPAWAARLANLDQAWAWRRADAWSETMLTPGREHTLEARLDETERRLRDTVGQLAAAHALRHCLLRMTAAQRQALQAYATAITNAGKGTSPLSRRHLKNARSAMREASGAVPAWVMPVKQVAQSITPRQDSFDVVVVDEASQVGLEGVMLLWLAPRVVIVGDDQQCAPMFMGGKHERLRQRFDELLPDIEDWRREGFDPKSNLYALLSQTFRVIRLTEHFRCMPEIIHWSSGQFYNYELEPLRQYGADRLPPLKVVHVPNGHCEGYADRMVNRPEAERIVDTLKELTGDPAYAKRTFGVVVLRGGTAHARLLEDLIDTRLDPGVAERHRIRVGTPAQFQGDERDIILLSMVIDGDNTRALTQKSDGRRFNVAASRARDQMWLFTSVTTDQLVSGDLRHNLLAYMQSPPTLQQTPPGLDTISPDVQHTPFESLFEQRVFLRIRQRGYHVVPQWRTGGKRIDLVVFGDNGRLAVECDGSPYHSEMDDIRADYERERELRRAGWRFWRVRSSAFALDPEQALEPLWERLHSLGIQPGARLETVTDKNSTWAPIPLADDPDDDSRDTETLPIPESRGTK